ncbi:MAG: serine--tRNA ligase, partial [Candidatus Bathyarchaeia archaeon]
MIKRVTFDLSCTFKLSRSEDVSDVLKGFIREANRGLLVRGAPKGKESEAAQIKDWKTEGNSLSLRIQSGTYVRAHTAVLRIRKALTAILGKERIGVKGVRADYYSVTLELEKQVSKDIEPKLSTLTKVLRATVDKNVVHVLFEPLSFQEMRANVPDRVLGIVEDILTEPRRAEEVPAEGMVEVIRQSPPKKIVFTDDPARVAMELGWIKEFPGRGQWVYTAPYAKLFGVIRDILIARVARRLEFEPFMLPKLIPLEVMKRMPGYLERIPEGMYYVCSPPRDPRVFDSFKGTFRVTKKVPVGELKRVIRDPGYVLAPAQCEPFWQFFSGETVDADTLPIKLFDCSGWTYRW